MQQGIGDLTSTAPGTAARFNAGKPRVDLLPLETLAKMMNEAPPALARADREEDLLACLLYLGRFQARSGNDCINISYAARGLGFPIEACADAFEYGLKKYAAWNWAKGMPWSAMLASTVRHLLAELRGEELDAESGCRHEGMAMFGIVCLATYLESYPEGDDRPWNLAKADGEAPK